MRGALGIVGGMCLYIGDREIRWEEADRSPALTGDTDAFPVMAGKGDRESGGRGTKKRLLHEVFICMQQSLLFYFRNYVIIG